MSYIDELRERFLAAEQRFGRINEAGKEYRERLMGLLSRIEEEIRCRRDVERQQAQEIDRLSSENEELRTMLMSLLQAVESGDPNSLDDTLGEMDAKVAALIGEGQGAPATAEPPAADEPADEDDAEAAIPVFSAGDMMSTASDLESHEAEPADEPQADPVDDADAFAALGDVPATDDVDADDDPFADTAEAAPAAESGALDASDPVADMGATSDIAEFYGAEGVGDEEIIPDYAHMSGGWDDFLNDDSVAMTAEEPAAAPIAEAPADAEAATDGDAEAGSIRNLLDRVKTEVGGDEDQPVDDADNGGATAAG